MNPESDRRLAQLAHREHGPPRPCFALSLLAVDVARPRNVGSLFRLADALGVACLYLCGATPRPPHPAIRKTARATERIVRFEHRADPAALLLSLRAGGEEIVALERTQASADLRGYRPAPDRAVCLVLGGEKHGLRPELLALADRVLQVPMFGRNSSLNVATAAAIALFHIVSAIEREGLRPDAGSVPPRDAGNSCDTQPSRDCRAPASAAD